MYDSTPIYMNAKQVAERYGVTLSLLAKMRMNRNGPPFYKFGARVLYNVAECDAWMQTQRIATTEVV